MRHDPVNPHSLRREVCVQPGSLGGEASNLAAHVYPVRAAGCILALHSIRSARLAGPTHQHSTLGLADAHLRTRRSNNRGLVTKASLGVLHTIQWIAHTTAAFSGSASGQFWTVSRILTFISQAPHQFWALCIHAWQVKLHIFELSVFLHGLSLYFKLRYEPTTQCLLSGYVIYAIESIVQRQWRRTYCPSVPAAAVLALTTALDALTITLLTIGVYNTGIKGTAWALLYTGITILGIDFLFIRGTEALFIASLEMGLCMPYYMS